MILPLSILAVTPGELIPCGSGGPEECNFDGLKQLITNVFDFLMEYLIFPIAVMVIMYAGFMTIWESYNGRNPSAYKTMLMNVAIGFALALGAYAIIRTVVSLFFNEDALKLEIEDVFN
jgi:cation transport ATPase